MSGILGGYDVASYQAGIDTSKVPGDFVIAKATEGTDYVNPYFQNQINRADQSKKLIGAYHFLTPGDPNAQAYHFNDVVKNYVGKALLIVDFEASAAGKPPVSEAVTFINVLKRLTKVTPVIYMGLSDENNLNWGDLPKQVPLWVAQYNNYNPVIGYQPRKLNGSIKHWNGGTLFQYTSTGRLPNWSGNLDLNLFYGDGNKWRAMAKHY